MANHADDKTRAWAAFSLSGQLRQNARMAKIVQKASEKARASYAKVFGEDVVANLAKEGAAAAYLKEADEMLERIVATPAFAETPTRDSHTLGELAASTLFRLRNLVPGKSVPEIVGTDLEGESIKLSDFKGKVVVVNFWGSWCGPCMAQVPEEKKLVEEFEGRPFVLLGINTDADIKQAKKIVARDKINWKSIHDGAPGDGPITRKWGIDSYPTGFVIDHNGVIVCEFDASARTKKLIEEKVAEAERAGGTRTSTSEKPE
jgi:thiol-disulfide isomerase/thioredoxin